MSDQDEERPRASTGSQLWEFLNSKFGLFLLSSVGVSLVTWMYTEVSQSVEQRTQHAELAVALDSEIEYRIRLMRNYFQSDCADNAVSERTLEDIRDIYKGDSEYQAIDPKHREKDLHTLIWERAALLESGEKKDDYKRSFNGLTMQFNAYLTRLIRETARSGGSFYGNPVDYPEEVQALITRFTSAIDPIAGEYYGIDE